MSCRPTFLRLCLLPALLGLPFPLPAQQVLVTGVEGQVFYGPGGEAATRAIQAGQKLGPGTFSTGNNGILNLSAFDGSELRVSETGTLIYDGDDHLCTMEGAGHNLRSNFRLKQGKAQITIRFASQPPHCYHVVLARAAASMANGQCVLCMHGGGATYIFVARGQLAISKENRPDETPLPGPDEEPAYGAAPPEHPAEAPPATKGTQWLVGNGKVGVVGIDGDVRILPLSALAAGTQTCLLAGFNPAVAEGGGKTSSPDSDPPPRRFRRFPVVSPTQ